MHLLDTTTKALSEFQGEIPAYAILSHVWEEGEVTFQGITDLNIAKKQEGFTKILLACKQAIKDGFKYIWIDTCCINKESSAELSEAINSMFMWYKNARVCYAYLSDVLSDENPHNHYSSSFAASRWFTRGWTLQELLAPMRVVFYGRGWVDIGTKAMLHNTITAVTGISTPVLLGVDESSISLELENVPVAVKMSWAAGRSATREEDIAYSLMGLFDVKMPLLYGEGRRAFIRLQHEIMKKSYDHSIFAWASRNTTSPRGMLARSPNEFRNSGQVEFMRDQTWGDGDHYDMTNKGLHIKLPLLRVSDGLESHTLALLNCCITGDLESRPLVVTLTESETGSKAQYMRSNTETLQFGIPQNLTPHNPAQLSSIYIVDDYLSDPTSYETLPGLKYSVLVTAQVPVEYGKIQHIVGSWVDGNTMKEVAKNQWIGVFNSNNIHAGQTLLFRKSNGLRHDSFEVTIGVKLPENVMWCNVDPLINARQKTKAKGFLDRVSVMLDNQWAVTMTAATLNLNADSEGTVMLCAEMEIKYALASPEWIPPLPVIKCPTDTTITCIVNPPAPHHQFTIAKPFPSEWVQHHSSLIVCIGLQPEEVVFENCNRETFCLTLAVGSIHQSGTQVKGELNSMIEWRRYPKIAFRECTLNSRPKTYYRVTGGQIVNGQERASATTRRCRDTYPVDYIVNIYM
jgi:hypothetical protein